MMLMNTLPYLPVILLSGFMLFSVGIAYGQEEANYEESKVPDYTLPALFEAEDGGTVESVKGWELYRRREIVRFFEEEVYGNVPEHFEAIRFEAVREQPDVMEGAALLREVDITVGRNGRQLTIRLNLFIPNSVDGAAPVFLLINHRGPDNMDPKREIQRDFWPAEHIVERGYAAAVFDVEDVADDNNDTYTRDLLETLYPEELDKPGGMRALSAWAWGAMRVMDYFVRDPDIDARRSAVVGHSRGGKAALWTGASDPRWGITISNESGAGGAALSRRRFGETVAQINSSFPYWFTPNFNTYNGNEDALPVDQHLLIACMAPRPVYVASAAEDGWADPKGEFLSLLNGSEVYRQIYGLPVALPQTMPEVNRPVTRSYAGYHVREGEHDLTLYDWDRFMDFADYHFK